MKKVPSFWWDFEDDDRKGFKGQFMVIIESDNPKLPIVSKIYGTKNQISFDKEIALAIRCIKELNGGRLDVKDVNSWLENEKSRKEIKCYI